MDKRQMADKRRKNLRFKSKRKPTSSESEDREPPKSVLESNWHRYEKREDEQDYQSTATDFAILSEAPIYQGSFQFKNDKLLSEDTSIVLNSNYFDLNLVLLNKSISTLPFYERSDIPKSYFEGGEIKSMDLKAEQRKSVYEDYLKSHLKIQKEETISSGKNICENIKETNNQGTKNETPTFDFEVPAESIGSLSIKEPTEPMASLCIKEPSKPAAGEDLEQWLDDILDD